MIKMTQKARKAAESLALWYGAYQRDYISSPTRLSEKSEDDLVQLRCTVMMLIEAQNDFGSEMVDHHSLMTVNRLAAAQLQRLRAIKTETA